MKPHFQYLTCVRRAPRISPVVMITAVICLAEFHRVKRIDQSFPIKTDHLYVAFGSTTNIKSLKYQANSLRQILNPSYLGVPNVVPETLEATFLQKFDSSCEGSHILDSTCLYVDVGTNKGQALFPLLRSTNNIFAIAFEPDQSNCDFVKRKAINEYPGRLTIHCSGVGALTRNQKFSTGASSTASFHIVDDDTDDEKTRTIQMTTIDEAIKEHEILLLKSDTQGFEKEVLAGANKVFSRGKVRFLIMEVSYILLRLHKTTEMDLLQTLYGWGYVCTYLAWHGVVGERMNGEYQYGIIPNPRFNGSFVSFNEFSLYLSPEGNPSGKGAWTDILCF